MLVCKRMSEDFNAKTSILDSRIIYTLLPAPDGDVIDLESKKVSTLLSFAKKGRPFVLNFGSYT